MSIEADSNPIRTTAHRAIFDILLLATGRRIQHDIDRLATGGAIVLGELIEQ